MPDLRLAAISFLIFLSSDLEAFLRAWLGLGLGLVWFGPGLGVKS